MKKCKELSQGLLAAYNAKAKGTRYPKVHLTCLGDGKGEGFELTYAGGVLRVKSQSSLAEVYALSLLNVVVPSGHWHDFLGISEPRFPLRALWLRVPPCEEAFHSICQRAVELAYNAIVWDGSGGLAIPGEYGLKAILCLTNTFVAEDSLQEVDYFLYEGKVPPNFENLTFAESSLKEILEIEAKLPKGGKLIYCVADNKALSPEQTAQMIFFLQREMKAGACLAFSATAGDPLSAIAHAHPFWEFARGIPLLQSPTLLPIFNSGGIRQGEGLWPSVCIDQAELLQERCKRHTFAGNIGLVNTVPKAGGFLDANLWVMAQAMWREISPMLLLETWLKRYKPEPKLAEALKVLREVRGLTVALSQMQVESKVLSSESHRLAAELALSQVRLLEKKMLDLGQRRTVDSAEVSLHDYLVFFIRDIKRFIKPYLSSVRLEEDSQDSIWTKAGGESFRKSFLEHPSSGHGNTKMMQIFKENQA